MTHRSDRGKKEKTGSLIKIIDDDHEKKNLYRYRIKNVINFNKNRSLHLILVKIQKKRP